MVLLSASFLYKTRRKTCLWKKYINMKSNLITNSGLLVNPFNYNDYSSKRVLIKANFYRKPIHSYRFPFSRINFDDDLSFRIVLCKEVPYAFKKYSMQ